MLHAMRIPALGLSAAALLAGGCVAQPADVPPAAALPPTPAVVSSCLVPGCDATRFIVAAIDGAARQIRGQAYNFTSAPIVAALLRAHARGVDVAMLLDKISPCQTAAIRGLAGCSTSTRRSAIRPASTSGMMA